MADMCRICGSKYPNSKWRRRLFGGDKTLATTLGGILGREVSESDQLPSTICSPCQNKLLKVVRLENELKTVKDWIISTFARYVDSAVGSKRAMGASPEGKPPSKKPDVTASPGERSVDVTTTSDRR